MLASSCKSFINVLTPLAFQHSAVVFEENREPHFKAPSAIASYLSEPQQITTEDCYKCRRKICFLKDGVVENTI